MYRQIKKAVNNVDGHQGFIEHMDENGNVFLVDPNNNEYVNQLGDDDEDYGDEDDEGGHQIIDGGDLDDEEFL